MAGPIKTSTSGFSSTVTALVQPAIEAELRVDLNFADPRSGLYQVARITKGHNSLTYVRYADLSVASSPTTLTEGTSPTADDLTLGNDSITPSQYGRVITITDLADAESPHDLVQVAAERCARNAAAYLDQIVANTVTVAGTTYGDASTSALSGTIIVKAVNKMRKSGVQPFPDNLFRAIISPEQYVSLSTDTAATGWIEAYKYTNNMPLLTNEVGMFGGCRFMISTRVPADTGVYSGVIYGPGGAAAGDLQSVSAHIVLPGGDHSDPLAQQAAVGWKAAFGVALLDAAGAKIGLLKSTETAL